ncbi:MAG TPA: ATP-binding cassette domain-containing protein [Pseudonocardiaceae bacterium]|jgi:molybdate transport system permease protein|nr:ATP-binding cassette domain-containing protein [Pseudonocardiaceae bacterium]
MPAGRRRPGAGLLRGPFPWLAALLVLYLVVPLVAFVFRIPGTNPSALAAPGVGDALWVSVITASVATGVITVLGVPLGYVLAHSAHRRTSTVIGVLVQLPLALPPLVSGILLIYLVGPYGPVGELFHGGLTDDMTGIVLAQVFVAAPFLVVSARSAFAAVDPALSDVAATLGHGPISRAVRVAFPAAFGGIRSGMLLAWLRAFGEFGATVVLAYHPYSLPVFIYVQFGSTGLDSTVLPVAVTLVAAMVVLLLADRWPGRRHRRARERPLPDPVAPAVATSPRLDFALYTRLGEFTVDVAHAGTGRHLAILGPSGSGKSATLRMLAGLLPADRGHVRLDDVDVLGRPAERRGVGYLPQDSTLVPHLRVWQQITFGVGADPGLGAYWLRQLKLDGLADRYPDQISGGQGRRVAMARALARQPALLLADEPFTGLDAPVRDELRRVLRTLQRDTALTTVLVTHDPAEAALLSDELVLLVDGRVLQAGPTRDVLAHPASPRAAGLLGIRNLGPGVIDLDGALLAGELRITLARPIPPGTQVTWCVRPEDVSISDPTGHPATVLDAVHIGPVVELVVELAGGGELTVTTPAGPAPDVGQQCRVSLPPEAVTVWPSTEETGIMAAWPSGTT